MKITIEMDELDLMKFLTARDEMRDLIGTLSREPLRFSLQSLSRQVLDDDKGIGLTPSQREELRVRIERGV